jgi:hypothetical protein
VLIVKIDQIHAQTLTNNIEQQPLLRVHALKLSKGYQIKFCIKITDISAQKTTKLWQLAARIEVMRHLICFPSRMVDAISTALGEV